MSPEQEAEVKAEEKPAEGTKPEAVSKAVEPNYYDQLLRLKADFENFRKRSDREKPELMRFGRAAVVAKLLPVYDLLQRAHEQILAEHSESASARGMEGIFKEFQKIFKEEGVTPMEPAGKPYDSATQEVLGTVTKEGVEDGVVVDVLQNGYMMDERVLRTAKVRIARAEVEGSR